MTKTFFFSFFALTLLLAVPKYKLADHTLAR